MVLGAPSDRSTMLPTVAAFSVSATGSLSFDPSHTEHKHKFLLTRERCGPYTRHKTKTGVARTNSKFGSHPRGTGFIETHSTTQYSCTQRFTYEVLSLTEGERASVIYRNEKIKDLPLPIRHITSLPSLRVILGCPFCVPPPQRSHEVP
jgi:hypothetical protein